MMKTLFLNIMFCLFAVEVGWGQAHNCYFEIFCYDSNRGKPIDLSEFSLEVTATVEGKETKLSRSWISMNAAFGPQKIFVMIADFQGFGPCETRPVGTPFKARFKQSREGKVIAECELVSRLKRMPGIWSGDPEDGGDGICLKSVKGDQAGMVSPELQRDSSSLKVGLGADMGHWGAGWLEGCHWKEWQDDLRNEDRGVFIWGDNQQEGEGVDYEKLLVMEGEMFPIINDYPTLIVHKDLFFVLNVVNDKKSAYIWSISVYDVSVDKIVEKCVGLQSIDVCINEGMFKQNVHYMVIGTENSAVKQGFFVMSIPFERLKDVVREESMECDTHFDFVLGNYTKLARNCKLFCNILLSESVVNGGFVPLTKVIEPDAIVCNMNFVRV